MKVEEGKRGKPNFPVRILLESSVGGYLLPIFDAGLAPLNITPTVRAMLRS